jgi:hypothetical protein
MGGQNETWMFDSRGQQIPLRSDPEGVWHHQQSFRLNFTTGDRLIKKHPRIAVVMAMREYPRLYFRPNSNRGRVYAHFREFGMAVLLTAIIYGFIFSGFFGARNWIAITITFLILLGVHVVSDLYNWRKADRRSGEIRRLLSEHPFFCAGCWYPLDVQIESDGCVICPECGAAWGLEPLELENEPAP